ncbi:unnamed protein product [Fusarium equiseti]|uniref:Uncharacterized protein n=1 Tax=Fusarium equiseti TaxID=61235 RepID=A0A8J2IKM9_FUSEQ|nr:unnamed protein product [Fusarium equiseti]
MTDSDRLVPSQLPSPPTVVTRPSIDPCQTTGLFPVRKRLEVFKKYRFNIRGTKKQDLIDKLPIVECLEGVKWAAIDILRIGYERSNDLAGQQFGKPVAHYIHDAKGLYPDFWTSSRSGGRVPHIRDWAIIDLDASKFTTLLESLRNTLPITLDVRAKSEAYAGRCVLYLGAPTITIGPETIPEEEIENTKFLVKYGNTTQYRLGRPNGIKLVLRHATPDGKNYVSSKWCVAGGRDNLAFSAEGDSGSCVFDLHGRIVGMITSGLEGRRETCDTTYVTPIHWLLEDIKQTFGELRLA